MNFLNFKYGKSTNNYYEPVKVEEKNLFKNNILKDKLVKIINLILLKIINILNKNILKTKEEQILNQIMFSNENKIDLENGVNLIDKLLNRILNLFNKRENHHMQEKKQSEDDDKKITLLKKTKENVEINLESNYDSSLLLNSYFGKMNDNLEVSVNKSKLF